MTVVLDASAAIELIRKGEKADLIETYLMQKEKKLGVNHYGLASRIYINGVLVIRPLLKYSKHLSKIIRVISAIASIVYIIYFVES